jgi:hypothetical protein
VSRSRVGVAATVIGASAAGAVAAISLSGGQTGLAAAPLPKLGTAEVVQSTLTESGLTEGTLGYTPVSPLINASTGTYTWLPTPGRTIVPGRALYQVDDIPIVLMRGRLPAWRPFELGMTNGPDISQLQAALIAEHFADGLLTSPTGEFTDATALAVERWQTAHGFVPTGQIPLGQIVFLPGPVRVGAVMVATGEPAAPGQQPYAVTTNRRIVVVPVTSNMPVVHVGEAVTIVLPSQLTTPGRITTIGPEPPAASSGGSAGGANGNASGNAQAPGITTQLTITPAHPSATGTGSGVPVQISLTVQVVRRALSVPVSALLALAGGGYGVEVVLPSGAHRLVGVTTGVFAGGRVQVSGPGLTPGVKVVVSQ